VFTPDNQLVIVGESTEAGAGLTLVDPATGDVVQRIPEARAPMAVSPDGGSVATRKEDALAIFDIATGARRRVLTRTSPTRRRRLLPRRTDARRRHRPTHDRGLGHGIG
jgi:hypothetical protein